MPVSLVCNASIWPHLCHVHVYIWYAAYDMFTAFTRLNRSMMGNDPELQMLPFTWCWWCTLESKINILDLQRGKIKSLTSSILKWSWDGLCVCSRSSSTKAGQGPENKSFRFLHHHFFFVNNRCILFPLSARKYWAKQEAQASVFFRLLPCGDKEDASGAPNTYPKGIY